MFEVSLLAVSGGAELLDQTRLAADLIAQGWDQTWQDIISPDSPVYAALVRVGRILAVITLMFWSVKIIHDYVEHKSTSCLHQIIWPLLVVLLLHTNGAQLTELSLGVRDVINTVNRDVLENTSNSVSLTEAFDKVKNHTAARAQIGALLEQCQALTGEQQIACLEDARVQSEEIIDTYGLEGNWITNLIGRINRAVEGAENPVEAVFAPFSALIGAAQQTVARGILIAIQIAWSQLFEVSIITTALLGPIAVGCSLLPVGAKAIYAWLVALFSTGLTKLCYNTMVGTAATVIMNSEAGDSLWFLIYGAFLAPFFAMALAAGGGMAVWSSITNLAANALGTALSFAK